jgi:proline iminopeptidase
MSNQRLPTSIMKDPVTWLYPPIEPFGTGRLQVSPIHEIYFEESGNPAGKPVVFLHGGPGGGSDPKQRRFFHPEKYRIVNFDQRGCGKSTPYASLEDNTTWDLVADIEKLREHLGIQQWQVFGGSWGSTLALAYSETHPDHVTELVLRGIFLLRKQEIDWFYQRGASVLYPDAWEPFLCHIPESERGDLLSAYYRRLTSDDPAMRLATAKIWSGWEGATSKLYPDSAFISHYEEDEFALAFASIEAHYFCNKGFLETDNQLLSGGFAKSLGPLCRDVTTSSALWKARGNSTVCGPKRTSSLHQTAAIAPSTRQTVAPWSRQPTNLPASLQPDHDPRSPLRETAEHVVFISYSPLSAYRGLK